MVSILRFFLGVMIKIWLLCRCSVENIRKGLLPSAISSPGCYIDIPEEAVLTISLQMVSVSLVTNL